MAVPKLSWSILGDSEAEGIIFKRRSSTPSHPSWVRILEFENGVDWSCHTQIQWIASFRNATFKFLAFNQEIKTKTNF